MSFSVEHGLYATAAVVLGVLLTCWARRGSDLLRLAIVLSLASLSFMWVFRDGAPHVFDAEAAAGPRAEGDGFAISTLLLIVSAAMLAAAVARRVRARRAGTRVLGAPCVRR